MRSWGAQDDLTNVLAVVLGVTIGSGDLRAVALATFLAVFAVARRGRVSRVGPEAGTR